MAKGGAPLDFLSKPALLASIAYVILAVMVMLPLGGTDAERVKKMTLTQRIVLVIVMLIPIGLSVYSINCMMVGKCYVWSWIQALAIAFWVLMFIVASMMAGSGEVSEETSF